MIFTPVFRRLFPFGQMIDIWSRESCVTTNWTEVCLCDETLFTNILDIPGLWGYLRLDESANAVTAVDSSPNHHDGTYGVGVVQWGIPGIVPGDTAIRCNGGVLNGGVFWPTGIGTDLRQNFTILFAVACSEPTTIPSSTQAGDHQMDTYPGNRWIVFADHGGGAGGTSTQAGVGVCIGTNGIVVSEHSGDHFPARTIYEGDIGTEYVFVAVVVQKFVGFNRSRFLIYVNGVYAAALPGSYIEAEASAYQDQENFASGNIASVVTTNIPPEVISNYGSGFNGAVDEVAYVARAMSAEEIANLNRVIVIEQNVWVEQAAPTTEWS